MSFYDDASLVLIPSGVKAAKVYSQKPTNGSGDLTFSRASTATRTNASGVIESVASNVPRLDYSGGATCPRLLLEPQRTNLVTYSEQFDNAAWTKNDCTISANVATSPDGYTDADEIIPNTSNVIHTIRSGANITLAAGSNTITVFAKANGYNFIEVGVSSNSSFSKYATVVVDLSNGTNANTGVALSWSVVSSRIENYENGYYRISLTFNVDVSTSTAMVFISPYPSSTRGVAYAGNGTSGIILWGAQLEAGAYATTYIPTTTAAVTRLADGALKTGISSLIGQQEGVVYWEGILPQESTIGPSGEVGMFNTERQPSTRTALTLMHRANTGTLFARMFIGNGTFVPIITLSIGGFAVGTFAKIAFAYKSGDSALYINGIQRATSSITYTSVTTMNDINFNDNVVVYGYTSQQSVAQALLFKTRLTNAQLAELTAL